MILKHTIPLVACGLVLGSRLIWIEQQASARQGAHRLYSETISGLSVAIYPIRRRADKHQHKEVSSPGDTTDTFEVVAKNHTKHAIRLSCRVNNATKLNADSTRVTQDYIGHENIQNMRRYTQLSAAKFKGIEKLF